MVLTYRERCSCTAGGWLEAPILLPPVRHTILSPFLVFPLHQRSPRAAQWILDIAAMCLPLVNVLLLSHKVKGLWQFFQACQGTCAEQAILDTGEVQ